MMKITEESVREKLTSLFEFWATLSGEARNDRMAQDIKGLQLPKYTANLLQVRFEEYLNEGATCLSSYNGKLSLPQKCIRDLRTLF